MAVAAGLAYPKWGERPYPSDSYPRIMAAGAIDLQAALKATSWGMGQILGENYAAAGFRSLPLGCRHSYTGAESERFVL